LAPIIIGGCKEELQHKKLAAEVQIELETLKTEKKGVDNMSLDELSNTIAERLNARGNSFHFPTPSSFYLSLLLL
jgi:hypothetical protein